MTPLEESRLRFEHAVKQGSYADAQHCLGGYTIAVNEALAAAGPAGPEALEIVIGALDRLRWADRAVRAGRAHTAAVLVRLASTRPYRVAPPQATATFQMEA